MAVKLSRIKHLELLWRQRILSIWLGAAWIFYELLTAIRDDFLPNATQQKYQAVHLLDEIPSIPLPYWIAATAIIIRIWVLESSFKMTTDFYMEMDMKDTKIAKLTGAEAELQMRDHQAQIDMVKELRTQNENYFELIQQHVEVSKVGFPESLGQLSNQTGNSAGQWAIEFDGGDGNIVRNVNVSNLPPNKGGIRIANQRNGIFTGFRVGSAQKSLSTKGG